MEEKRHQCEKREARARKRTARTIATKQSSKRLRKSDSSNVRARDLTRARAIVPPVPPVPRSGEFDLCSYCVFNDYCAARRNASVIDAPIDDFADVLIELYCHVS